ncbi:thiol-disulfide oxidoreductase DCC family protein [uncultured Agrococcus sp.]|uniref:thiol-disulfide oxidoreductase DCC family protein n=1 Tax=uncultured Agrococcus sp. TaxID=382258 RepID=UPI0025E39949|nr:DUF393 domain-containing protein [uncultured Agrococcus sp.]
MTPALLVYDGDCSFCTSSVQWLQDALPRFPKAVPYQHLDLESFGLDEQDTTAAAWLIDTREPMRMWAGADVFAAILAGQRSLPTAWAGRALSLPGIRTVAALGYRVIAQNRHKLPGGTPACALPSGRISRESL